jgi:hypothetical protein
LAKTFRNELEVLTVELVLKEFSLDVSSNLSEDKARTIKISAYPSMWRWLEQQIDQDRRTIDELIEGAIRSANEKLPVKNIKSSDIGKDDFDKAFSAIAAKEQRQKKGVHHRGRHGGKT